VNSVIQQPNPLSKYQGALDLRGLTKLSDTAAESLGKHRGELDLTSQIELSDTAYESLRSRGSLRWNQNK